MEIKIKVMKNLLMMKSKASNRVAQPDGVFLISIFTFSGGGAEQIDSLIATSAKVGLRHAAGASGC